MRRGGDTGPGDTYAGVAYAGATLIFTLRGEPIPFPSGATFEPKPPISIVIPVYLFPTNKILEQILVTQMPDRHGNQRGIP